MTVCNHRKSDSFCPISKTPCIGECIYANILDDISLGIIGLDLKNREVFYQNRSAVDIFKSTIKPRDYKTLIDLLLPKDVDYSRSKNPKNCRTLRYGNRFIGYTVYPISDIYHWIYITDITEKVRLNTIAESVNTMTNLGYIFSGIRHEMGNPINSIKTTMTVLKNNVKKYSRENIAEYIDRVLVDLTRVESLLKDLKTFSMYENPELKKVNMASFMDNLLSMVKMDFDKNNIRIKTIFRTENIYGYFDARALQHVMLNVLTNASDALQGISSPRISIILSKINYCVIIQVKDNGSGISDEQKKNLFKPFATTKTHGTGLGLVNVRKMLAKMNGTIEIESRPDDGALVTLTLPGGDSDT